MASNSSVVSLSSSGSTVDWTDARATHVTQIASSKAQDCTWYADASCKSPRTCFDCLNVKLPGSECAVVPTGACVSLAEYQQLLNEQQDVVLGYKYYPSDEYTYCGVNDSTCSACTSQWLYSYEKTGGKLIAMEQESDEAVGTADGMLPDGEAPVIELEEGGGYQLASFNDHERHER
ncbi:hypothetical protein BBJ28_00001021 [Nothophytophthora sp. Chile5]|nr:hypothetical protein BBJ28_00001021 [Nothophytophthora sp. Chile5]